MNNDIVTKLQKILNLAKSSNQGERDAAMERAAALAAKHNIDLAFIPAQTGKEKAKEDFAQTRYSSGARSSVCQSFVSTILMEFFNVKIVKTGNRNYGISYIFLGRRSQVDFALYVQDFLREHMMTSWNTYQTTNKIKTDYRYTYLHSFWKGLSAKLKSIQEKTENETFVALPEGQREQMGLVLFDEENARDAFMHLMFPDLKKGPPPAKKKYFYDEKLIRAGYQAGHETNISMPLNT